MVRSRPSRQTGHADYFGKVVNQAARVAFAAEAGQIWLGMAAEEVPELERGIDTLLVGKRMLKGVQDEMALVAYACSRAWRKKLKRVSITVHSHSTVLQYFRRMEARSSLTRANHVLHYNILITCTFYVVDDITYVIFYEP
jgi:glutathione S-transferase